MRKITLLALVYCIFSAVSLVVAPSSHAETNAWWAWPGQQFDVYKQGWFSCSVGFPAMDRAGNHYFITAGHCFRSHDLLTHYEEDPDRNYGAYVYSPDDDDTPVGWETVSTNLRSDGTYLDISLVEMYQGQRIYGDGWEHIPNSIVSDPDIGDAVCLVGFNHDKANCGTLTQKHYVSNISSSSYSWNDLDWATYCSHPGDSGGAVYNRLGALGINVSGDPNHNEPGTPGVCGSGFVPIEHVLSSLRETFPDLFLV